MTSTQLSIETAPRNLDGLKNIGRFNLRTLAQQLGHFESEANKTAFLQLSNDQQAETVLTLLNEKDGNTGKPAKGGATGRAPSTKNVGKTTGAGASKPAGEAANGSGGGAAAAAGNSGGTPSGAGAEKILKAIGEFKEVCEGIKESVDALAGRISVLEGISSGTNRFVTFGLGLELKLAEQVLGAGAEQVLEVVLEDMPIIEAAIKKLPAADDEEAEGDDEEEGNGEE